MCRQDNTLGAGKALVLADLEEAGDLFVNTANSLDVALLVDRACDANVLPHRDVGDSTQESNYLGSRGTVTIDTTIGLFKCNAGCKGNGLRARKQRSHKT